MSDVSADIDNNTDKMPSEPKLQPIFMKMAVNLNEIITNLENSLDCSLKKKDNGNLIQIYPTDISQYRSIQK